MLWGAPGGAQFHSEGLEKPEAVLGGRLTGPVCSCLCLILSFCPQWSQAAPMAEGEQKAHQGESPGSWTSQGLGEEAQFLLYYVGGRSRGAGIWGSGKSDINPSFWKTLLPAWASSRNRTCGFFLLVFPVKFSLEREP